MSTYSDSRLSTELQAKSDRIMTSEEFTQVVEAILQGRYSWACVLILRSAGYNPLHYIPYRTYKRIVKENRQDGKEALNRSSANSEYHPLHSSNCLSDHPFDPMTAPR